MCDIKVYVSTVPFRLSEIGVLESDLEDVLLEPHGWGYMWSDVEGRVRWFKTLNREAFVRRVEEIMNKEMLWFAMHGRTATAGKVDELNAHPIVIRHKHHTYLLMHNGMVRVPSTSRLSDTVVFAYGLVAISREFGRETRNELLRNGGGFFVFWDAKREELVMAGDYPEYELYKREGVYRIAKWGRYEEFEYLGILDSLVARPKKKEIEYKLERKRRYYGRGVLYNSFDL